MDITLNLIETKHRYKLYNSFFSYKSNLNESAVDFCKRISAKFQSEVVIISHIKSY